MKDKVQQNQAPLNPLLIVSGSQPVSAVADRPNLFPLYNLVIILVAIFLGHVVAMLIGGFLKPMSEIWQTLLDALIMAAIAFPVLYFLSFRPLLLHIQQRNQADSILRARLRLMQFAGEHSLDELLQFTLDELENLTGSTIGFFHFLEADQKTLWLVAWSTQTLHAMCSAEAKDRHYDVEQAGVWADAVRHRGPVIHNDLAALPNRKGMPEGHAIVEREMVVPVLRANKVMAVVGLGNKPQAFNSNDIEIVSTLADFAWDIVKHKQAEDEIRQSEEKFRTLVDWTYDWEMWLDPEGNFIYTTPSCERITGYTPEEFMADPNLLVQIVHPEDRQSYREHHKIVHDSTSGPVRIEYRNIARDGSEHWIEHVCRPLFGKDDRYLGRRISNREITERKQAERKIIQQTQNEAMLTQTIRTIQTDMARDLHDTLGQNIGFLRMNLEYLSETQCDSPAQIAPQIQHMTKVADESYDLVRAMLAVLQADYSTDSISLFTRYAERVAERSAFQIGITSRGNPHHMSSHQIRQLFYIFREALSNSEKYAKASQVSVEFIWEDQALTLVISDNGVGFDPQAAQTIGHYGLKFMRERADLLKASISFRSSQSEGTTITVIVPYEASSQVL